MKIYKLSERMIETFGMEDAIVQAFRDGIKNTILPYASFKDKKLLSGELLEVAKVDISSFLEKVIEKHGPTPRKDYSNVVYVCLIHPDSHSSIKKSEAFFMEGKSGKIYIVIRTKSVYLHIEENKLKTLISHEVQHLLKNMYHKISTKRPSEGTSIFDVRFQRLKEYYSSPHEIQAYTSEIARKTFNDWKEIWELRNRNLSKSQLLEKIRYLKSSTMLSSIVKSLLSSAFRGFDKNLSDFITNTGLKDTYLYYCVRNLETFLNKYLNEQEQRLSTQ